MTEIKLNSRFGRVLALTVIALLVLALATIAATEGWGQALQSLPPVGLMALCSLALFFWPRVEVGSRGVRLVNVLSSVLVPWGQIQRIDTKYALTLYTAEGKFSAWGAPAPGRHSVFNATKQDGGHLPESTYLAGTIRPGDLAGSDSGGAAAVIRREWERRRDLAGGLDTDESGIIKTWHWRILAGVAILAIATAATAI